MRRTSAGAPLKAKYAQLYKHKHGSRVHWNLFLFCWISFLMTGHNGGGKKKKGTVFDRPRRATPRSFTKQLSHGNQAGERAFETRKQKDDKVQPLSSVFLLISAPSPPPTLLRFVQRGEKKKKKKKKMEKDIKDISDDRWGGITKEKTSRDGSSSTKQNAKMQKKKKRC